MTLATLTGPALKQKQRWATTELDRAETAARLAEGEPKHVQDEAIQGLLDAIALNEEFGELGMAC